LSCLAFLSCSTMNEPQKLRKSELHARVGTGLLNNNRLPQAMGEFLRALELDPKNKVAHNNLALAYFLRNRPEQAERHLRKALRIDSKYTEARNNLGRVLIGQKKYSEAIATLQVAREDLLYPFPDKILTNLGMAYFEMGKFNKSRNLLKQAISINQNSCIAYNLWARSMFESRAYYDAAAGFDQAIQVCKSRKFDEPQYFAGMAYLKVGKRSLAKTRFEELINDYPVGKYHEKANSIMAKQWPNETSGPEISQ